MSMSISFHGKGHKVRVRASHYPDGIESDPEPYDSVMIYDDENGHVVLYLAREQTEILRAALDRLAVDHPTLEPEPVTPDVAKRGLLGGLI